MFIVKKNTIERMSDTEFLDRVSFLVGAEEWNEKSDYVVLDFKLIPTDVKDEDLNESIATHIRDTIARDTEAEVSFATKFPWE